jgi:hypothetical protein
MADELKVGDRVKEANGRELEILALQPSWAWCRDTDNGALTIEALTYLTRISPAVPQAKFRVGQRVLDRIDGEEGEIISQELIPRYKIRLKCGGWERITGEDELEAVPVCPTCGGTGKVGDAD